MHLIQSLQNLPGNTSKREVGKLCLHSVNFIVAKYIFVDSYKLCNLEIWYTSIYEFCMLTFSPSNILVSRYSIIFLLKEYFNISSSKIFNAMWLHMSDSFYFFDSSSK
jgi:hypothetical protein